jgi:hypothetical protein
VKTYRQRLREELDKTEKLRRFAVEMERDLRAENEQVKRENADLRRRLEEARCDLITQTAPIVPLKHEVESLKQQLAISEQRYCEALSRPPVRAAGTSMAIEWLRGPWADEYNKLQAELVSRELDRLYAEVEEANAELDGFDAVAIEVAKRGTAHLHTCESPLIPAARLLREAREEREATAAEGDAQRTVYVPAVDGSQALTNIMLSSCWSDTPEHAEIDVFDPESMQVYAVTLTARKVGKP